jgi:hypothetical protein
VLLRLRTVALSAIEAKNGFPWCYSGYGELLLVQIRLRTGALRAGNDDGLMFLECRQAVS